MEKINILAKLDTMLRPDGLIWFESQDVESINRDFDEFEDIFINRNYVKLYKTERYHDDVYPRECIYLKSLDEN